MSEILKGTETSNARQALREAVRDLNLTPPDVERALELTARAESFLLPPPIQDEGQTAESDQKPPVRFDPEHSFLTIKVHCTGLLWQRGDDPALELIRQYTFDLMLDESEDGDDDPELQRQVGHLCAAYFQGTRALNERWDIFDAADSESESLYEAACALFTPDSGIRDHLLEHSEVDAYDAGYIESV